MDSKELQEAWAKIKTYARQKRDIINITDLSYHTWIRATEAVSLDRDLLTVRIPSDNTQLLSFYEKKFKEPLEEAASLCYGYTIKIRFITSDNTEDQEKDETPTDEYTFPPLDFLCDNYPISKEWFTNNTGSVGRLLERVLRKAGFNATVSEASSGPTVTRYEIHPEDNCWDQEKIASFASDIRRALVRTDMTIPGETTLSYTLGIEIPYGTPDDKPVSLRTVLDSDKFKKEKSKTAFAVGADTSWKAVIGDIQKMAPILIAGEKGTGKSVLINSMITSMLYHSRPEDVRMILIDSDYQGLYIFDDVPHMEKDAVGDLSSAVSGLYKRYDDRSSFMCYF